MKLSRSPSLGAPTRIPCVIVEDDAASRLILERLIAQEPDLELIQSIGHGDEAYTYLLVNPQVRLLLLDIQIPGRSGIELLEAMPRDGYMHTILVTNSKDFAVDAYKLEAIDYLVKPLSAERFKASIDKVRRQINNQEASGRPAREVFLKSGYKMIRLPSQEMLYLEAYSDSVHIHMASGEFVNITMTLKELEARLAPFGFLRVHRSYVINVSYVDQLSDSHVHVNGKEIPVSKAHQEELYKRLRPYM